MENVHVFHRKYDYEQYPILHAKFYSGKYTLATVVDDVSSISIFI
jgi:hypothetical protein